MHDFEKWEKWTWIFLNCFSGDEIELATTTTSSDIEVISSPLLNLDRKAVGSPTNAQAKSSSTKNKPRSKG